MVDFQVDHGAFFVGSSFPVLPGFEKPADLPMVLSCFVVPRRKICNAKRVRTMQTVAGSVLA